MEGKTIILALPSHETGGIHRNGAVTIMVHKNGAKVVLMHRSCALAILPGQRGASTGQFQPRCLHLLLDAVAPCQAWFGAALHYLRERMPVIGSTLACFLLRFPWSFPRRLAVLDVLGEKKMFRG